jgi:hypothetical protein
MTETEDLIARRLKISLLKQSHGRLDAVTIGPWLDKYWLFLLSLKPLKPLNCDLTITRLESDRISVIG